jgi:hypothetical protein
VEVLRSACLNARNVELFVAPPSPGVALCVRLLSSRYAEVTDGTMAWLSVLSEDEPARVAMIPLGPALVSACYGVLSRGAPSALYAAQLLTNMAFHLKLRAAFRAAEPFAALMPMLDPALDPKRAPPAGSPSTSVEVRACVLSAIRNLLSDDTLRRTFAEHKGSDAAGASGAASYVRTLQSMIVNAARARRSRDDNDTDDHLFQLLQVTLNVAVEGQSAGRLRARFLARGEGRNSLHHLRASRAYACLCESAGPAVEQLASGAAQLVPALLSLLRPELQPVPSLGVRCRAMGVLSRVMAKEEKAAGAGARGGAGAVTGKFMTDNGPATVLRLLSALTPARAPSAADATRLREPPYANSPIGRDFELTESGIDAGLRALIIAFDAAGSAALPLALKAFSAPNSLPPIVVPPLNADGSLPSATAAAPPAAAVAAAKSLSSRSGFALIATLIDWPLDRIAAHSALAVDRVCRYGGADLVPALESCIDPLVRLMAHSSFGTHIRTNAAIAAGRLYIHEPFRVRIREAGGTEMMFHLTKSLAK